MNPPVSKPAVAPSWILFIGLLLGGGLLVFMGWESFSTTRKPASGGHGGDVIELTEENWKKEVLESKVPVVVDFTADWCGPCQDFAPILGKVARAYAGKVKVGALNVDSNPKIVSAYGIRGIPRVMIFKGSEKPVVDFNAGAPPEKTLTRALDSVLAKN